MAKAFLIGTTMATAPVSAHAASDTSQLEGQVAQLKSLRAADARVFNIFWRLSTKNVALCEGDDPATGMLLQARSSYDGDFAEAADRFFGFEGEVSVEALAPNGPADRAGVKQNDTLVAINGKDLPVAQGPEAVAAAQRALIAAGKDGTIDLTVLRDHTRTRLQVSPLSACPGRVEVTVSNQRGASTDGSVLQISSAMLNALPGDGELASVIAHEYSHVILHHPSRLTAAHVDRGLLASFGKNRRLIRRTEEEADRLSVYLLLNAGYDPMAPGRFWRTVGRNMDAGFLSDGTHMGWRDRAEMVDQEAARAKALDQRPAIPALLATRDDPLE
ncbi:PDZ domain-containing protein [Stakelama sp. CBK3Z-3]|uniref:PDZ domain-containing protein n=1 Tax=Stakelama flava TaxID=2860338 RepID=A0ABS6XIL9_9SPHN|nr:PDZ domain-containing protein [Stakelama flava]MBW4329683.1 PDZ domain-containing protein [Stakelama flava]